MFENIMGFFKKLNKNDVDKNKEKVSNKDTAKERLHLVLMQDRANVSADFLDLMKQEIIEVIKKYIDVDEKQIDVKLTNKQNSDGTTGAPALYANIPIKSIKKETRKKSGAKELKNISDNAKKDNAQTKKQNTVASKETANNATKSAIENNKQNNNKTVEDTKNNTTKSENKTDNKDNAIKKENSKETNTKNGNKNPQKENKNVENSNNKTKEVSKKK